MAKKSFVKSNKVFKINLLYLLSLIPVVIFAFYKNGIVPAQKGSIPFWFGTQYIVIPIIIVLLSYVFEVYYYTVVKKEDDLNSVYNSIAPFINVLCYLVTGPANKLYITIPIMVIVDVLLKFIDKKFTINQVALYKCILFGVLFGMGVKTNANYYEATIDDEVTKIMPLFIGKGIGSIGTTSALCAIIGYVILLFNTYYKKEIPIVTILGYAIVALIVYLVKGVGFMEIIRNTLNSGFLFAAVFVASLSNATPVVRSGRVVYALCVGILSAVAVNILNFDIGIYIVILALSVMVPIFNKFKLSVNN